MDPMPSTPEFNAFIASLNEHNVRYLLIGGYAVALYGHVRYTKDMDFWVAISPDNADNVARAIETFAGESVPAEKFLSTRTLFRIGVPPIRIEIVTEIDGVNFDECYARRETKLIEGLQVDVISLWDLRMNKQASGRPQDLADLDNLPET